MGEHLSARGNCSLGVRRVHDKQIHFKEVGGKGKGVEAPKHT